MATTYYKLYNGKRRLITLVIIVLILIAFFLPFLDIVFSGDTVSKVTGFEMLLGQRGYGLIKEMGLDMGFTRQQLTEMSIFLGYIVMPLLTVLLPVAALLLAIHFIRQSTRGGAIMCAIMMLVSLLSYHFTMENYEDKRIITLRVVKRYVGEEANKSTQFVVNETPNLEKAKTPQEKADLQKKIDAEAIKSEKLTNYLTFLESKIPAWEHIQIFTDVQDKAKQEESAKIEDENNAALKFEHAKFLGLNTVDIIKLLMLLALISAVSASIGSYKISK